MATASIKSTKDGSLLYIPDEKRNILPDFSQVVITGMTKNTGYCCCKNNIACCRWPQRSYHARAIDEASKKNMAVNGFKGVILLRYQ